jgi:hypothetical protein
MFASAKRGSAVFPIWRPGVIDAVAVSVMPHAHGFSCDRWRARTPSTNLKTGPANSMTTITARNRSQRPCTLNEGAKNPQLAKYGRHDLAVSRDT